MGSKGMLCLGGFSNCVLYLKRCPGIGGSKLVICQRDAQVELDINGIHAVECFARAMGFDAPHSSEIVRWQKDIAGLLEREQEAERCTPTKTS